MSALRTSVTSWLRDGRREMGGWLYSLKRAMYPDGRPNGLARIMNRMSALQHSSGVFAPKSGVTLEVRGRRSGRTIAFPLCITQCQGERYLVSMLGNNANWVRNVQAAGGMAVLRRRRRQENVRLEVVEPALRAPILRRYLALAPGARPHVPVDRHAPVADFEQIAADFPVFRICPARAN